MGYMYDIMEGIEDKLKSRNKLISIIKKLDPDLLNRAKRIACGKEKMPIKCKPEKLNYEKAIT